MKHFPSFFVFAAGMCLFGASGLSCGDGETGGGSSSSAGSGSSGSSSSSSSSGGDCGGFCGCWEPTTMTFDATIQDATTMMPLAGIELFCKGENTAIAMSDATGKVSYSIETMVSPGCDYERCNNMVLHDPTGAHMDLEGTYFSLNGTTVSMP
jgi:hypothetical protein